MNLENESTESTESTEVVPPSDPHLLEKAHAWGSAVVGLARDLKVETGIAIR